MGTIGPQEISQNLPGMRLIGLHGQIGQKRAHLAGFEPRYGLSVQRHLERTQQGQRQICHRSSLSIGRSDSVLPELGAFVLSFL